MTQPDHVETLAAQLVAELTHVHERILAELEQAVTVWGTAPPTVRARRLREVEQRIQAILNDADLHAAAHITRTVGDVYELGAWVTALTQGTGPTFTAIDADAVAGIVQDTLTDVLRATRFVRQEVKATIRRLTREAVTYKVTTGRTALQTAADLVATLRAEGITSVIYANGARVPLPAYARMLIRTRTAETYQEAGFNQGERLGIDQWLILDGPGCGLTSHDDPQTADGMVVDLDTARKYPISHPNCRRSTTPNTAGVDLDTLVEQAIQAQSEAHRPHPSTTPRRRAAGTDFTQGALPATASARKHAAVLTRHGLTPPNAP